MTPFDKGTINYRDELVRKLIHLCSLSIPIIYYFIPQSTAIIILSILTILAVALDVSRHFFPAVGKLFYMIFGFLLRKHEKDGRKKNLNGATYVFISALLGVIIFPKVLFLTAFPILIISDSTAALIGRKFGKHKLFANTLPIQFAFFITSSIEFLFTNKSNGPIFLYSSQTSE